MQYTPNTGLEIIYVLLWWLMLEGVGLLALPITFRLFRHLPGRGYVFAKPLGLVLVSYALWILSTLGILRNTWGNILLSAVLVLGLAVLVYRRGRSRGAGGDVPLSTWLRGHLSTVLAAELVFTLAFLLWVLYKAYDPNIAITEKPMEFAFLNAISRSDRFPPYDPWMSGYGISYYYFGYVIIATLAKFAQVPTNYAFNLGIATLFALTASGAYGVVYEMVYLVAVRRAARRAVSAAITYGVLAAVLIALMGNLEGALEFLYAQGIGVTVDEPGNVTGPFWDWIDVKNLNRSSLSGTWYPTDGWWWWRASRVIHDKGLTGGDMEVIDEFPAFSFLLGDMHPHVLAYPFVFLLIALALHLLAAREVFPEGDWWLVYLCLGAIGFLNTWDMPFYYFLLIAAYALNRYLHRDLDSPTLIERALRSRDARLLSSAPWLRQVFWRAIELALVSVLLYLPYWLYSRPQAGAGVLPNLFNVSRFSQLFLMFGTFFFALSALLAVLYLDMARKRQLSARSLLRQGLPIWVAALVAFPLLLALVLVPVVLSPSIRTYIDDVLDSPQVQQFLGPQTLRTLLQTSLRIRTGALPQQLREIRMPAGPWTHLILSLLIAAIVLWFVRTLFARPSQDEAGAEFTDDPPLPSLQFAMLMAFTGLMLIFSVEFLYLRDAFGTRMNTVFKFYFQAWALLGLVAAFGAYYVLEGYARSEQRALYGVGRWAFGLVFALLVLAGLLYPLGASIDRAGGFAAPPTLDGIAFVAREHPEEYAAIRWLNENVSGNPVIAEAVRGSFAYEYARVSSRTGLPTVMGWMGHEDQWHGLYDEIRQREQDIKALYGGGIADAQRVMDAYDIEYVFVGYLERAEFPVDKFGKFMDVVFRDGDTVIYKRRGA